MQFLVLSRQKIASFSTDIPHIVISIVDKYDKNALIKNVGSSCIAVTRLKFDDYDEDTKKYAEKVVLFNKEDAKQIVNFVKKYINKVDLIVCQCEAGISRSAGVAAALSKYITGSDEYYFKYYIPNSLVYKLLINELYKEEEK